MLVDGTTENMHILVDGPEMLVVAALTANRVIFPSPLRGIPAYKWTRPNPRRPSSIEDLPMKFTLLINTV